MRSSLNSNSRRVTVISSIVAIGAIAVAAAGSPARAAGPAQGPFQDLVLDVSAVVGGPGKPATPLLDSRLAQLAEIESRDGAAAALEFARANAISLDDTGRANVLIHENADRGYSASDSPLTDDPEQRIGRATFGEEALFEALEIGIRGEVERLGGDVRGRVSNLVDASVPIGGLRELEPATGMRWVEPAPTRRRTVVSEGVAVINADELQASSISYRPTNPIKVGVIDLGFKGYQDLVGTELPADVTVNSFSPGGINGAGLDILDQVHGTACAEIIYDIVPGAEMFLANFDTLSEFDEAVDWMIAQDVDVISYSIGWFNAGPGDGTGPVNAAVERAMNAGIEYVVSAGNEARAHWEGQYSDPDGDDVHNFSPGDESNAVFLNAGEELTVFLNWDDWFQSDQDYDLYILNTAGDVMASSTTFQTGSQNPAEAAGFVAPASDSYHVVITRWSATRDVNLEMFFFVGPEMQYIVPAGSLTIPADTDGAVAVGATYFGDDVIEAFSSQGPTADGRTKPDLSAPDGVSTVSYGDLGLAFFGTSASAPHVAGSIALMKARFGVFSLEEIREILYGRALDRGIQGMDNLYGHGRLDVKGQ